MTCPHCAFDNPSGMAFCGRCGTKLASLCPACGFANPEGFEFCGKCGSRLAAGTAPSLQSPAAVASPRSYTPKHLAEKILTSKSALEGERKQVTVLFADLKGSMELLADRDPEEARKLLDPVLERMMEAVHRYEGTVNQVMGDGIMALFGAPVAHEDHAVRACYAALRMQRRVNLYADELQRGGGTPVQIRVGLNSGEVVVRSIGSDLRMDYTAVGQTTHLAARMEQMAKPGSVLVTGETLNLAEGFDLDYTFKHALTHEVAYGSVLQERRRALHARIVEAIEVLYPERLTEQVERLAHHAFRGEVWEKAVTYLRQAGAKAIARSANREATACFEQALAALQHLPDTRQKLEHAIDLRLDLRQSLFPLAEFTRLLGYLREAEGLARTLDDPRRLGWVSYYMSHNFLITGHPTEARAFAESARTIAETLKDFSLQIGANVYLGATHLAAGDPRRAEDILWPVLRSLQGDLVRERLGMAGFPAVMSRFYLGWALTERGAFDEGITTGQEGVRIAEAVGHPYSLACACWRLGYLYGVKGDFNQAIRLLERSVGVASDWNLPLLSPCAVESLGHVYALSGRVAEGLALLHQAVKALESIGITQYQLLGLMHLGEACLLVDLVEDALALAWQALALSRERGKRGYEAYALRLLGKVASHRDPPDVENAEEHCRQALALATELGMRPLVAHCHLGLGTLYRRTGEGANAAEHLTTAATMYREMDMRFWLAQAEANMAKLG